MIEKFVCDQCYTTFERETPRHFEFTTWCSKNCRDKWRYHERKGHHEGRESRVDPIDSQQIMADLRKGLRLSVYDIADRYGLQVPYVRKIMLWLKDRNMVVERETADDPIFLVDKTVWGPERGNFALDNAPEEWFHVFDMCELPPSDSHT